MSCNNLRNEFVDCVMRSDCVLRKGNTPQSCIKEHANELPEPCQHLRVAFFECKRGMVSGIHRLLGPTHHMPLPSMPAVLDLGSSGQRRYE